MLFKAFYSKFSVSRILAIELFISSFFISLLALATPIFVIQVLSRYLAHSVDRTLVTLSIGVLIAIFLEICFRQLRGRIASVVSNRTHQDSIERAFQALSQVKMSVLEVLPLTLREEVMRGFGNIKKAYSSANLTAVLDVPFAGLFLLALALLSPLLFIVALVAIAGSLLVSRLGLSYARNTLPEISKAQLIKNTLVDSTIVNGDALRAFNGRKYVEKVWKKVCQRQELLEIDNDQQQAFIQSVNQGVNMLTIVLIIGIGAKLVISGYIDIGALIGANILASRALISFSRITPILNLLVQAQQSEYRLEKFLKLPHELTQGTILKDFKGHMAFRDVGFVYPGSKTPLFEGFSLEILPGDIIGITGPNGAGKTTFVRMLIGLLEPGRGRIEIEGVNLEQINLQWWRQQINYLPQELTFMNVSIRDNLLLSDSKISHEAFNEIVRLADLRDYLDSTTDGLQIHLTDNANHLSIGIRRRIALARALVTQGQLSVFDEPTEALDKRGCQAVYEILNYLFKKKKNIIVCTTDPEILKEVTCIVDLGTKPTPTITRKQ